MIFIPDMRYGWKISICVISAWIEQEVNSNSPIKKLLTSFNWGTFPSAYPQYNSRRGRFTKYSLHAYFGYNLVNSLYTVALFEYNNELS